MEYPTMVHPTTPLVGLQPQQELTIISVLSITECMVRLAFNNQEIFYLKSDNQSFNKEWDSRKLTLNKYLQLLDEVRFF